MIDAIVPQEVSELMREVRAQQWEAEWSAAKKKNSHQMWVILAVAVIFGGGALVRSVSDADPKPDPGLRTEESSPKDAASDEDSESDGAEEDERNPNSKHDRGESGAQPEISTE